MGSDPIYSGFDPQRQLITHPLLSGEQSPGTSCLSSGDRPPRPALPLACDCHAGPAPAMLPAAAGPPAPASPGSGQLPSLHGWPRGCHHGRLTVPGTRPWGFRVCWGEGVHSPRPGPPARPPPLRSVPPGQRRPPRLRVLAPRVSGRGAVTRGSRQPGTVIGSRRRRSTQGFLGDDVPTATQASRPGSPSGTSWNRRGSSARGVRAARAAFP